MRSEDLSQQLVKLNLIPVDTFIFKFYHTELNTKSLHKLADVPGSVIHLRFLQEKASTDNSLQDVAKELNSFTQQKFYSKGTGMYDLAEKCIKRKKKVDPDLPVALAHFFEPNRPVPKKPHLSTTLDLPIHGKGGKITKISAHRIFLPNFVSGKDISFEWLEGTRVPNTVLEMKVVRRYPRREILKIREGDGDLIQLAIQEFSKRCIEEDFDKDCDANEVAFEIYHMKHTEAQDPRCIYANYDGGVVQFITTEVDRD
jgi:hypothetical protein